MVSVLLIILNLGNTSFYLSNHNLYKLTCTQPRYVEPEAWLQSPKVSRPLVPVFWSPGSRETCVGVDIGQEMLWHYSYCATCACIHLHIACHQDPPRSPHLTIVSSRHLASPPVSIKSMRRWDPANTALYVWMGGWIFYSSELDILRIFIFLKHGYDGINILTLFLKNDTRRLSVGLIAARRWSRSGKWSIPGGFTSS